MPNFVYIKLNFNIMSYHNSKTVSTSFEETINLVTEELKKEGFGVLTEIDVKETLKKKIDVDFREIQDSWSMQPLFSIQSIKCGGKYRCDAAMQCYCSGKR